jgi:hypothetical protein
MAERRRMNRIVLRQMLRMLAESERAAYDRGYASGLAAAHKELEAERAAPPDERKTYTVDEARMLLGVSRNAAFKAVRDGKFPTPVVRIGGRWLVLRAPLDRVLYGNGKA